jgi:hypothetical protein
MAVMNNYSDASFRLRCLLHIAASLRIGAMNELQWAACEVSRDDNGEKTVAGAAGPSNRQHRISWD